MGFRLEITDDGKSFSADRMLSAKYGGHLGLLGMRERVEIVGGRFMVESAPGKGTTVTAEIPFETASSPGSGDQAPGRVSSHNAGAFDNPPTSR